MPTVDCFLIPILQLSLTEFRLFTQDHMLGCGPWLHPTLNLALSLHLAESSCMEKAGGPGEEGDEESILLELIPRPGSQVDTFF